MFASAMRATIREGYDTSRLRSDVMAGLAVGVLAIPLAMALAIASGVPPQHGLYTAAIGGAIAALCGGSRVSVTGPTAAFVVLLAPVAHAYGLGGLALATLLAGVMLLAMGVFRLGRLVEFIPYPVTTGFTAGIGVVIASLQVEDLLGLTLAEHSHHFVARLAELARAISTIHPIDSVIGVATLLLLVFCARRVRVIPGPLIAIPLAAVAAWLVARAGFGEAATIGSRFSFVDAGGITHSGVPLGLPHFELPWRLGNAVGEPLGFSFAIVRDLIGPAATIALLGAIESLLCAAVADGMTGARHDPDGELLGQGLANIVAPFLSGIAATGAIARTATNVRSGATSPVAALVHALLVLGALLALGPLLSYVPMAALAALLVLAAWNMSDVKHVARVLRIAPRQDKLVLVTCFVLTVIFDMVIAVGVGVVLAALLFMRHMATLSGARILDAGSGDTQHDLPSDVLLYEIRGPLFFAAAEKAVGALRRIARSYRRVILDLTAVPTLDITALIALESAIDSLNAGGMEVVIVGAQPQPKHAISTGLGPNGRYRFAADVPHALAIPSEGGMTAPAGTSPAIH
jgi:sulfate permease, SulP family